MSHYSGSVPDSEPSLKWLLEAACRAPGIDPDTFFPDNNVAGIEAARAICRGCPVIRDCLIACLRHEGGRTAQSRWGIYAGLTPRQRVRAYEQFRDRAKQRTKAAA